ncbi:hypothetical protein AC1031_004210 [Aphanomyces cochlioides]|nr:hypothetical protein AC1031_004210 [Aphanomyces cochlioides]
MDLNFLLEQFLFSGTNIRTDEYGGSLPNRIRFVTDVLQAVTDAIGSDKVGIRFSPLNRYLSMQDEDPLLLSEYLAKAAQLFNLAYIHVLRRDMLNIQEDDVLPIFRQHFHNTLIGNVSYTKDEANESIASGQVDAVAFGISFVANPDLAERFAKNAELATADREMFYVGGAKGNTDYPTTE